MKSLSGKYPILNLELKNTDSLQFNYAAEMLNGKIPELKLTVMGYRIFSDFRSAILFFHGGLNLYPLQ